MPYQYPIRRKSYPFHVNNIIKKVYKNIVVIGASIVKASFGQSLVTPNAVATSYFNHEGVEVYGYGWSGYDLSQLIPKVGEALAAFPDGDTRFIIQAGGNDVTALRPYSTATALELSTFQSEFDSLLAILSDVWNDTLITDLTFRNYDNTTLFNQDNGSRPFIDSIYKPARNSLYTNVDGNSVLDWYNYVRNNYSVMLSADNVHMSPAGETMLREFTLNRVSYLFDGGAIPDPILDTIEAVVDTGGTTTAKIINFGSNQTGFSGTKVYNTDFNNNLDIPIVDVSGTDTGLTVKISALNSSGSPITVSNNVNGVDLGLPFANTLMSNPIHQSSCWWSPNDNITLEFKGFTPMQSVILKFVGTRVTSSPRVTQVIDLSNTSNFSSYSTSKSSPDQPSSLTLVADALGVIKVKVDAANDGTAYAYLGGIELI